MKKLRLKHLRASFGNVNYVEFPKDTVLKLSTKLKKALGTSENFVLVQEDSLNNTCENCVLSVRKTQKRSCTDLTETSSLPYMCLGAVNGVHFAPYQLTSGETE
jgi:hypothetical protein